VKERIGDPRLAPRPDAAQLIEKELFAPGLAMVSVTRFNSSRLTARNGKYRFVSMGHLIDSNAIITGKG
jgi:hypothetical protein